jgi:hypothetical protein
VYTATDIKNIASLYFEGAELSAVLEVIEKVEDDSHAPETMNTDPGDPGDHPPAINICLGVSKDLGSEGLRNSLETDCDSPSARGKWYFEPAWRGLH